MLRDMDFHTLRIVLAVICVVWGAFYLITSRGKPPDWTPKSYSWSRTPRFMWGRDRVRAYSAAVLVFGVGAVAYLGFIGR